MEWSGGKLTGKGTPVLLLPLYLSVGEAAGLRGKVGMHWPVCVAEVHFVAGAC